MRLNLLFSSIFLFRQFEISKTISKRFSELVDRRVVSLFSILLHVTIALEFEIQLQISAKQSRLITAISKNVTDPADYSFVRRYRPTAN